MPQPKQEHPPFVGFALPTSNTTYTPNQFFDVCLPHASRGTVRVVAFIIRKTLGWCDAQGNPQAERHTVSYADFEAAGISRAMIRPSIREAIAGHFIRCIREPQAKGRGREAISGLYELQWDERGEYIKDPRQFRGFFAGEGNRTYIPNQFFDHVVVSDKLAVIKVVGAVIRLSIGFANKWGNRRRNVALSLEHIKNYSRLSDTKNVSDAVQEAMEANYIERVEKGYFDTDAGKTSRAAVYALKWAGSSLEMAVQSAVGMKLPAAANEPENRSEITIGIGSKSPAADRYEITSDIEIKQRNKTLKQQPAIAATFERLKAEGFDGKAAQAIASRYLAERVERQIRWLDSRKIKSNRLGMLRAAIEQDWPPPSVSPGQGKLGRPNSAIRADQPSGKGFADALERARQRFDSNHNPFTP